MSEMINHLFDYRELKVDFFESKNLEDIFEKDFSTRKKIEYLNCRKYL